MTGVDSCHFTLLSQLEDEALKHIGAHCPKLVTLNLQTCSVSRLYMANVLFK